MPAARRIFFAQATVKPGVDPAVVEKRLDEIIQQYVAEGPTADELARAATREVGSRMRALEQVGGFGGKAVTLAEGEVLAGDSDFYKKTLANYATITPAEVKGAMAEWLTKPAFSLRLEPGDRPPYVEAAAPKAKKGSDKIKVTKKRELPPLSAMQALGLPGRPARCFVQRRAAALRAAYGRADHAVGAAVQRGLCGRRSDLSRASEHDAQPSRRGHDDEDVAADRGRGRAAGRRDQRQRHRPTEARLPCRR
jgi:hypothetical protein